MENRGDKDDKMSGRVWKAVETGTGKIRVGETERRRSKGRSGEKERRKGKEEETEKRKNDGNKESSREMGDMG